MRGLVVTLLACALVWLSCGEFIAYTNPVLAAGSKPHKGADKQNSAAAKEKPAERDNGHDKDSHKTSENPAHKPTRLYIKSGTLVSATGAPIQLRDFDALIVDGSPRDKSAVRDNNNESKIVTVQSGSAFLTNTSLGQLLNAKLAGHNLEDLKVTSEDGKVKISGKAKKIVGIPFSVEGPVSLTQQGFIRLETDTTKVAKLPGLAGLLGVNPQKLAPDGEVKGVSTQKDAITFDPDLLWGLPVHGRVTRLAVEKNGLLLVFGGHRKRGTMRAQLTSVPAPNSKPAAAK